MIRRTLCRAIPAALAVLALALGPVASATAAPATDPVAAGEHAAVRDGGWLDLLARLFGVAVAGAEPATAPAQWGGTLAPTAAGVKTTQDDGGGLDPTG